MSHPFLDVVDRDEAERRFHAAIRPAPLGSETVPLDEALGRVLAADVGAAVDVPSFDRSNLDGFAVAASDTYGASEEAPRRVVLLDEAVETGAAPSVEVAPGTAARIATGGMLPRGADAIVMVEHADVEETPPGIAAGLPGIDEAAARAIAAASAGRMLVIRRAVTPGSGVTFAGTDITAGETVLRRGELLTSRETGVLAAVGVDRVPVWRRPRVAIVSTGDEIIAPGEPMRPGKVFDSNARILADAVRELGAEPLPLGVVADDAQKLRRMLDQALERADVVLFSGGTSKGEGDLCYQVLAERRDPGIIVHGVALRPGKPICLAATAGKPVVVLPGFPTSAIFTFHELVAPLLRRMAGLAQPRRQRASARLAVQVRSEIGRTEYLLVGLVAGQHEWAAYPMGKGSGSVTAFSRADGFITIDRAREIVPAGTEVEVQLLGEGLAPADLVVIGSHCVGLDWLLGQLNEQGVRSKLLAVGSAAGLEAARRGECDVAGVHLLDPQTGIYNRPFLTDEVLLVPGYGRQQGIVFRRGDQRFSGRSLDEVVELVCRSGAVRMVNRNRGSGTRVLIDQLLAGATPPGYAVSPRSHNAVVAAVVQQRADWGVAIRSAVRDQPLDFLPLVEEQYDFVVPTARRDRPAVEAFARLLEQPRVREALSAMGFRVSGRSSAAGLRPGT